MFIGDLHDSKMTIRVAIRHDFPLRCGFSKIFFAESTKKGEGEDINAINKCKNCYLHHFPIISFFAMNTPD